MSEETKLNQETFSKAKPFKESTPVNDLKNTSFGDESEQQYAKDRGFYKGGLMGAVATGAVALSSNYFFGMSSDGQPNDVESTANPPEIQDAFCDHVTQSGLMSGDVNDNMAFADAFRAAREEVGPGGFFVWNGQVYNTFLQEEWEGLNDGQQQAYVTNLNEVLVTDAPVVPQEEAPAVENDSSLEESATNETVLAVDIDEDGIPDALLINADDDNMVEGILFDTDQNGIPEALLLDADNDNYMEALLIDEDEDGIIDAEELLEEPMQIFMPEADTPLPPADDDIVYDDDDPDLDNHADMSDWV